MAVRFLARGDRDARSDVDLLVVAPDQSAADQLAEALLGTGLADDVISLSQGRWQERQRGEDPWWRGICREAIRLHAWLRQAHSDLAMAAYASDGGFHAQDCYQCSQAAEKEIKALLLAREVARAVVGFADQQLWGLDQPESS